MNRGTNNGISGIISFANADPFPPINVYVLGFALALAHDPITITGPGDGFAHTYYGANVGGSGSAHGKIQSNQRLVAGAMHNLQGTLTVQIDASCTIAMPVLIKSLDVQFEAGKQEDPTAEIEWMKNGVEAINWNGSAYTYTQPILIAKEKNEGTERKVDPRSLTDTATTSVFFPTVNGTNPTYSTATTYAAIAAYHASATPPAPPLKVINSAFVRIDDAAGILLTQWGLKDSKDDYELPATKTTLDPSNLQSTASAGNINNTVSAAASGFVIRAATTNEVTNPATGSPATLTVTDYGLRLTTEDITFPGTFIDTDPNDLITKGLNTYVGNNSAHSYTAPTGLKIRTTTAKQITSALGTNNQWEVATEIAKRNSVDDLVLPATRTITDVDSLNSMATVAAVDATPADIGGLFKTRDIITTHPTTDHSLVEKRGGLRSHADDLLFPAIKSFRSAQSPYIDYLAVLVAASGTVASQANTLWAAFQSVAFAEGLWVYPRTDGLRKVVYIYRNPGILFRGASGGGERSIYCRVSGGNPQVYVVPGGNLSFGSGWRQIRLGRVMVQDSTFREFSIMRLITGTTIPEAYPSTINGVALPHKGDVLANGTTSFLGLADGTCQYKSPAYRTNLALSGTLPFWMRYTLRTDDQGFINGLSERYFREPLYLQTSATNTGWTNVSTLNIPDVTVPGTSQFSAFVA